MSWDAGTIEKIVKDALVDVPATMRSLNSKSPGAWTRRVKDVLCDAGLAQGFKVGASTCHETTPSWGEWLYDLTWAETEDARLISLPLAVESEWGQKRSADLTWDFNKLIQSRAGLRVMIFEGRPDFIRDTIIEFKKLAQVFAGSQSGDRYLFAGFDWETGEFHFDSFATL